MIFKLNSPCSRRNWAVSWGSESGSGKKQGIKDGDTNHFLPSEFQLDCLITCKFKCHLPVFSVGCPNACDKRKRNKRKLRHIVKASKRNCTSGKIIQQTEAGVDQNKLVCRMALSEAGYGVRIHLDEGRLPYFRQDLKKLCNYMLLHTCKIWS